jgi:hypothetical protein
MTVRQNAYLTFKENANAGRHGWLRLTPAYSYRLVADTLSGVEHGSTVLDPFSGSGTTGLFVAEAGLKGVLLDINPFLIWLAQTKTGNYAPNDLDRTLTLSKSVLDVAEKMVESKTLWEPPIANIQRWWPGGTLDALKALRAGLDECCSGPPCDLLKIALCRTLIDSSSAAFNHQSMSFKTPKSEATLFDSSHSEDIKRTLDLFGREVEQVVSAAANSLPGSVNVLHCDARSMDCMEPGSVDVLYTSPPYANRMSYIRELRPYMYWLRYLTKAVEAGELDWQAIGGTWGIATARVGRWEADSVIPLGEDFQATLDKIALADNRSAGILSRYVAKYFHDMWSHFKAASAVMKKGGQVYYVVGNSTFFGNLVPTEEWYSQLLAQAGFDRIHVEKIRKRNSKAELYEFVVNGRKT